VRFLICWLIRQRTLALRGLVLALGIGLPLVMRQALEGNAPEPVSQVET